MLAPPIIKLHGRLLPLSCPNNLETLSLQVQARKALLVAASEGRRPCQLCQPLMLSPASASRALPLKFRTLTAALVASMAAWNLQLQVSTPSFQMASASAAAATITKAKPVRKKKPGSAASGRNEGLLLWLRRLPCQLCPRASAWSGAEAREAQAARGTIVCLGPTRLLANIQFWRLYTRSMLCRHDPNIRRAAATITTTSPLWTPICR
mmetsp:Transcript_40553/g.87018  ORF Transcript_40553/g.87018 Transcript_40553/m.87018 type:complete len:209 (-) Transcript_40553:1198-1824(-)